MLSVHPELPRHLRWRDAAEGRRPGAQSAYVVSDVETSAEVRLRFVAALTTSL